MLKSARQVQFSCENQKALAKFKAKFMIALEYLMISQHSCLHQPHTNQINIYIAKTIVSPNFKIHSFMHSHIHSFNQPLFSKYLLCINGIQF